MTLLPEARYDEVMAAFGGKGYLVRTVEELRRALELSLTDWQRPSLLNVLIDPSSDRKQQVIIRGRFSSFFCGAFLSKKRNPIRLYDTFTEFFWSPLEELLNSLGFMGQVKVIQISRFTHRFADLILTLIQPASEMWGKAQRCEASLHHGSTCCVSPAFTRKRYRSEIH